jgi:hypothetical protein
LAAGCRNLLHPRLQDPRNLRNIVDPLHAKSNRNARCAKIFAARFVRVPPLDCGMRREMWAIGAPSQRRTGLRGMPRAPKARSR